MSSDSILDDVLSEFKLTTKHIEALIDNASKFDPVNGPWKILSILLKKQKMAALPELLRYILDLGADPSIINEADAKNICASILLRPDDGPEILGMLIDRGLKIDECVYFLTRHMPFIEVLIEKGYDTQTILKLNAENEPYDDCDPETCNFIIDQLKAADIVLDKVTICSLFKIVLSRRKVTMSDIELFLDHGLDLRYNHDIFLTISCEYGHIDVTKYLIDRGLDININDGEPLYFAMVRHNILMIELLLDNRVDVTKLHIRKALRMINQGSREFIDLFINYGAISYEQLARIYLIFMTEKNLDVAKMLVTNNIDFNELIMNCEKSDYKN